MPAADSIWTPQSHGRLYDTGGSGIAYRVAPYRMRLKLQQAHIANGQNQTSGSAMAEGPRDALVSRNSATTKYPYRMALFA